MVFISAIINSIYISQVSEVVKERFLKNIKYVKLMNTADYKSFSYFENGKVLFSEFDSIKTTKKLDPGFYTLSFSDRTYSPELQVLNINEMPRIYDFTQKEKVEQILTAFFDKKVTEKIKLLGFDKKLGILLHGKEGAGKSSIIKYYANLLVQNYNAVVFYMDRKDYRIKDLWAFVQHIRNIQSNTIVTIFEEIDGLIKQCENEVKPLLDGNASIDNNIILASTNYITYIPDAIKNRPSRFKYSIEIGGIDNPLYIRKILDSLISTMFSNTELTTFSEELKGSTLDVIKQFCFDKIMNIESYTGKKNSIGFLAKN